MKKQRNGETWKFEIEMPVQRDSSPEVVLGIDGGTTSTVCICMSLPISDQTLDSLPVLARSVAGCSNHNSVGGSPPLYTLWVIWFLSGFQRIRIWLGSIWSRFGTLTSFFVWVIWFLSGSQRIGTWLGSIRSGCFLFFWNSLFCGVFASFFIWVIWFLSDLNEFECDWVLFYLFLLISEQLVSMGFVINFFICVFVKFFRILVRLFFFLFQVFFYPGCENE